MVRGLCVTVLLAACGGGEAPSEPATSGTGGASSSGSSTAGAGAGNGFVPRMFHLSVLAETEPGRAPALLRLDNATPEDRLAITLPDGEAFATRLGGQMSNLVLNLRQLRGEHRALIERAAKRYGWR